MFDKLKVILKKDKDGNVSRINASVNVSNRATDVMAGRLTDHVLKAMAEKWVEEQGDKVLEMLSPEAVAEQVKKEIARKVLL